jgi:phosphonatase-like hydrolase
MMERAYKKGNHNIVYQNNFERIKFIAMIKMVVFDIAGTTIDENNVVYKTLRKAIKEAGFDFTLDQVLAEGAGKEKRQAIKDILKMYAGNSNDELSAAIYQNFITQLAKAYEDLDISPVDGAEILFHFLRQRNILVVLNTGYNDQTARTLINKLGWEVGGTIDGLITASDVPNNRPMPDMILLAMKKFGITDPKEVIKVGDSMIDIEEGKNAGCRLNIGITTGAHTPEQLLAANPDFVIHNLLELIPVLEDIH